MKKILRWIILKKQKVEAESSSRSLLSEKEEAKDTTGFAA